MRNRKPFQFVVIVTPSCDPFFQVKRKPAVYPKTVKEVLDDNIKFKAETLKALYAFKRAKPWQGNLEERFNKFKQLNKELAVIYKIPEPRLILNWAGDGEPKNGYYVAYKADPETGQRPRHEIHLVNSLAVTTYLHEFGHALGHDEFGACRFSLNLYRKVFPKLYEKMEHDGHLLVRPSSVPRDKMKDLVESISSILKNGSLTVEELVDKVMSAVSGVTKVQVSNFLEKMRKFQYLKSEDGKISLKEVAK